MVFSKGSRGLVVLLPLLVVTVANATPTVNKCNSSFVVPAVSPGSDSHIPIVAELTHTIEPGNSHLAGAAAEFLKPPPAFTGSSVPPIGAKSLPAVPGAVLMVLTGFLCVSLVKDRKVWLAALAGLLWAGQYGVQVLPQLAIHLSHARQNQQQVAPELTYTHCLETSDRLRSDIEGTQYIGLLRHLAGIPHRTMSFLQPRLSFLRKQESSQTEHEFRAPQFAIMGLLSHLIPVTNCSTLRVEQFICFSPAFIIENLPRGPPKLA